MIELKTFVSMVSNVITVTARAVKASYHLQVYIVVQKTNVNERRIMSGWMAVINYMI